MPDESTEQPPDRLTTFKVIAGIAIPAAVTVVGYLYTSALKERDVQAHFVELAVAILQQHPDPNTRSLRGWAIDVVNRYSGVKLPESTATALRDSVQLPAVGQAPSAQQPNKGLQSAYPTVAYIKSSAPLRITWWHDQTKSITHVVDRTTGPGLDSLALDTPGTIHLRILNAATGDTIEADLKRDCSQSECFFFIR